jgi:methyltransferase (TIGR00027 family)
MGTFSLRKIGADVEAEPSRSAMLAAVGRGRHRLTEAPPWILDDPFALVLVGPIWREIADRVAMLFPAPLERRANAGLAMRSRFAEDRLQAGTFDQYVMLGAGLDSFVWRRPDLLSPLRVFELDHPASQAWKRQRVDALALPRNENHVVVPIDFERASLREVLDDAAFEWDRLTLFSWLGVTPYLTVGAIEETVGTIRSCRSGSEVVFTYAPPEELLDPDDRETLAIVAGLTASSSEPIRTFFTADDVEALLARCGLRIADHADRSTLVERYCAERTDGLQPWGLEHLVTATVP